MALERRLGRQDSLLAALDVLLIGRRETAVSVEGNGIFLRHMYAALRLELPAAVGPDQRDRNDLLIVSDMFQVRERRVELGHIGVGDIVDVAKPVVPDFLRLADDVVFIVLAEQAVGLRMLLRIIYIALDQNSHFSHFKLFQLVSRRGFGRSHRVAFNENLSGASSHKNPLPATRIPGRVYPHNGGRFFMLLIAGMTGMLAIVKRKILIQVNGDLALPFVVRQLLLIAHRVIAVHQTITVIMVVGSLANDIDNVLAKVKVIAHFGISGCCITYNTKDDRSVSRSDPLYIIVSQCDGFRGSISSGKGVARNCFIVLIHILRCIHRDRAGVRAGAALNVTNGKRTVQQGICLISVVNTGVDAVNCHLTQQVFDILFVGLAGLCGINRGILFPHSIQRGGSGHNDAAVGLIVCGRCTAVGVPSEEGIAVAGRRLRGNGESMGLLILRGRLVGLAARCAGAVVGIIVQRESQQNGRAFEIVICGVLAVGKQGACALAASVAAASGPTDVVDLVIVNTLPDILCIGKTEGIVVDVVLAEVNGDVIAADA